MVSPETGLPAKIDFPSSTGILWKIPLGSETHSSPVVSDGRLFIGTNNEHPRDPRHSGDRGVLLALDAAGPSTFKADPGLADQWQLLFQTLDGPANAATGGGLISDTRWAAPTLSARLMGMRLDRYRFVGAGQIRHGVSSLVGVSGLPGCGCGFHPGVGGAVPGVGVDRG
jgi:hypothetical protein